MSAKNGKGKIRSSAQSEAMNQDLPLIVRAASYAAHKHREQRRKGRNDLPYINHPLELAEVLCVEGGVTDPVVLAGALLHDTIEDTETTYRELRVLFGARIADVVLEVTDTKFLSKELRKRLQVIRSSRVSAEAAQIKIADKICNLRSILSSPPGGWSLERIQTYFDWAHEVIAKVRYAHPALAKRFDALYRRRPK
jgi:guanosine-3',5'-bis(diphosphate) 3'-pyrophosphohydrolase